MKHIGVVTGATGYIGSHLVKELINKNWEVYAIVREGSQYDKLLSIHENMHIFVYDGNLDEMSKFFKNIHPNAVFHLAASAKGDNHLGDSTEIVKGNINFGIDLLEAMRYAGIKQFINTGTYWQNYNSETYSPVNLYAATKEAFEVLLQYYVDVWDFKVISLHLFDVYGEDDERPKLLTILKNSYNETEKINISPAEQFLDMVHVTDVCKAYIKAYEWMYFHNDMKYEKYCIYTGKEYMLKDIIKIFEESLGRKLPVNIGGKSYKRREIMKPIKQYKCLPNWNANITLVEGLKLFKTAD